MSREPTNDKKNNAFCSLWLGGDRAPCFCWVQGRHVTGFLNSQSEFSDQRLLLKAIFIQRRRQTLFNCNRTPHLATRPSCRRVLLFTESVVFQVMFFYSSLPNLYFAVPQWWILPSAQSAPAGNGHNVDQQMYRQLGEHQGAAAKSNPSMKTKLQDDHNRITESWFPAHVDQ